MTQEEIQKLKADFMTWSGGFEPESEHQIVVYMDYTCPPAFDRDEALRVLEDWMSGEPPYDGSTT